MSEFVIRNGHDWPQVIPIPDVADGVTMNAVEQFSTLVGDPPSSVAGYWGARQGFGAAVAASGDVMVAGAPGYAEDVDPTYGHRGAAFIYYRNASGGWEQVKKLTGTLDQGAGGEDYFGASVAVDGDTVVVGCPHSDGVHAPYYATAGSVYVFGKDVGGANNWGLVKWFQSHAPHIFDAFGLGLALSGDTIVVSNTHSPYHGEVFSRDLGGTNNWGYVKSIVGSDMAWLYGRAAIEGDTIFLGGTYDPSPRAGAVYVFSRNAGGADNWGQIKKILCPLSTPVPTPFGESFAVSNGVLVVGRAWTGITASQPSIYYLFAKDAGGSDNWGLIKEIPHMDDLNLIAQANDHASGLAISGDSLLITRGYSVYTTSSLWNDIGFVLFYSKDKGGTDNWGLVKQLSSGILGVDYNNDPTPPDVWSDVGEMPVSAFGFALAIAGSDLIVGAPNQSTVPDPVYANLNHYGTTYVFKAEGPFVKVLDTTGAGVPGTDLTLYSGSATSGDAKGGDVVLAPGSGSGEGVPGQTLVLGDMVINGQLSMLNNVVTSLGNPVNVTDAVNKYTLDQSLVAKKDFPTGLTFGPASVYYTTRYGVGTKLKAALDASGQWIYLQNGQQITNNGTRGMQITAAAGTSAYPSRIGYPATSYFSSSNTGFTDAQLWTTLTPPTLEQLNAVHGVSRNDLMVVGNNGTILRWNGTTWSQMPLTMQTYNITGVWMAGTNDAFTIGNDGAVLHWNGSAWAVSLADNGLGLYDIWGFSSSDVYVTGRAAGTPNSGVQHWDGATWSSVTPPIVPSGANRFNCVHGTSGSDVWVATYPDIGTNSQISHFNGSTWSLKGTFDFYFFFGIWAIDALNIFAIAEDPNRATDKYVILHSTDGGTTWPVAFATVYPQYQIVGSKAANGTIQIMTTGDSARYVVYTSDTNYAGGNNPRWSEFLPPDVIAAPPTYFGMYIDHAASFDDRVFAVGSPGLGGEISGDTILYSPVGMAATSVSNGYAGGNTYVAAAPGGNSAITAAIPGQGGSVGVYAGDGGASTSSLPSKGGTVEIRAGEGKNGGPSGSVAIGASKTRNIVVGAASVPIVLVGLPSLPSYSDSSRPSTPLVAVFDETFESGNLSGWTATTEVKPGYSVAAPTISTTQAHGGTYSCLVGATTEPYLTGKGSSILKRDITLPAAASISLVYWWWSYSADISYDRQYVEVRDSITGAVLATIFDTGRVNTSSSGNSPPSNGHAENSQAWNRKLFSLTPWAGQTVTLVFAVYADGFSDATYYYLDDISIFVDIPGVTQPVAGTVIWNTDHNTLNISTGTGWVNALGTPV